MTRYLLSFLAGTLVTTGAVMYADGRAAFMFVVGVGTVLVAIAAALSSGERAAALGRFLIRAAGESSKTRPTGPQAKPVATKAQPVSNDTPLARDVQSALQNFGMPKLKAGALAAEVTKDGGSFDTAFRDAMKIWKAAA